MLRALRHVGSLLPLLSLIGCSSAQSQAMGPKTWLLRCESSLTGCATRAKNLCREEGFWIVRGHSYTILAGIEGDQIAEGEHEMVIECGMPPEGQRRATAAEQPPSDAPIDTTGRVKELLGTPCVPGETQECVGSAACRGGQQCLESGAGFSPCDCGGPTAAAEHPATASTPAAAEPARGADAATSTTAPGDAPGPPARPEAAGSVRANAPSPASPIGGTR